MCSRFYTNTVDSLPQHTFTYVTTNNVLISSVRTEQTNALTETTTISELNDSSEAERYTTTDINTIMNSQVPTKMFKGDNDPALFVDKNNTADESDWTTTRDPNPIVTITITEPSEEIYNGYTVESRESIFSDERADQYDISSTRRSSIDSDKTSPTVSWTDSTDTGGLHETTTSNAERAVSTDDTRTGAVPPNLIKDNNDNSLENSTRFSEPETITVTAVYDENSKITGSNGDAETTLMTAAIDAQSLESENAVRDQNVNAENSTGPQSSTTPNPFESFTKRFADRVPSTAVTTQDDLTDPGRGITESLTEPQPAGNVGTTGFPTDTTAGAPTAEFTSIRKPDEFRTTTFETIRAADNGSANDTRTGTENQMYGNDVMEATTLGNIETNTAANGNVDTGIGTTTAISEDNVEKNAFTEPVNYGWSDETTGFVDTTTLAVRKTAVTGVYPLSDNNVGSSTGKGRETTATDLDESMDSRTISLDGEDDLKLNNATAFTTRPSHSNTVGGSTVRVGNETIDTTTVRPVFDGEPTTFVATSDSLPAPATPTTKTAETGSVTAANPTENDWTTTVGSRGGAPTTAPDDKSPTTGSASSSIDGQTTADNTLTTTTTTTPVSLADATAVFNVFTTSVEMLVSSLNAENDSMTTEMAGENHYHPNTADGFAGDVNDTANESATYRETVLDETDTTDDDTTDDDTPTTTEYTVTSNSVQVGDAATQKPSDQNTDINDNYAVWQTTTTTTATTTANVTATVTADTGQRCRTDTDCDAGHKCVAVECLPPTGGESRVNNCPPGIVTLQCLQGIIYT